MDATSTEWNLGALPDGHGSLEELARDLSALGGDAPGAVSRWMTRPAVLRRVGLALADEVPATANRIITGGEGAPTLGAAVSLITGLPFAVIDADQIVFGELHHGEDASLFAVTSTELEALRSTVERSTTGRLTTRCVFGASREAVFFTDDQGVVTWTER
ncbi:hypothetical protein [Agromyces aerolatus]|uniref:hypothetical protein n=1 Tax=Agromyces sp. LY-1074 TaxID=3074080 RepID=UPI00285F7ED1|nr:MULTISPECIES: hypothetical protein [unclassified Agromyces]MDR5700923.1 hypothetical protein [Agromyces sp. LY-1074]MDR5707416.1 hypothetical protein [Agromyces sp. LY-1358]